MCQEFVNNITGINSIQNLHKIEWIYDNLCQLTNQIARSCATRKFKTNRIFEKLALTRDITYQTHFYVLIKKFPCKILL